MKIHSFAKRVVSFVGVALAVASCTRAPQGSKVSLEIPGWSEAQATKAKTMDKTKAGADDVQGMTTTVEELGHLVVNITGITTPITFIWDSHDGAASTLPHLEWTVPNGSQPLIQVLATYRNTSSQVEDIYYGDSNPQVNGDVAVDITILKKGSLGGGDNSIAGRYLSAANTGPTGNVLFLFKPAADKPAMTVAKGSIYNGWFRFFAPDTVNFTYVMEESGLVLFSDVNVNSSTLLWADQAATTGFDERRRALRVSLPLSYTMEYQGGTTTKRARPASKKVFGFFGPGVGSQFVCYEPAAPLYGLYQNSNVTDTTNLSWSPTGSASQGIVENVSAVGGRGGVLGRVGAECPAGVSNFTDSFFISPISGYGGFNDRFVAFQGPFRLPNANSLSATYGANRILQGSTFTIDANGKGQLTLNWEFVPGMITQGGTAGPIAGVAIFRRSGVESNPNQGSPDYASGDGLACGALESFGFAKIADLAPPTSGLAQSYVASNIEPLLFQSAKFQVVACPYSIDQGKAVFAGGGIDFRSSKETYLNLVAQRADGSSLDSQLQNECVPYQMKLRTYESYDRVAESALNLSLKSPSVTPFVYSTADCSDTPSIGSPDGNGYRIHKTLTMAAGANRSSIFYVKSSATGSLYLVVEASGTMATNVNGQAQFRIRQTGEAPYFSLLTYNSQLLQGRCFPMTFTYQSESSPTSNPTPIARSLDETFNLGGASLEYYDSPSCAGSPLTSLTVVAGKTSQDVYVKAATAGTLSPTISRTTTGGSALSLVSPSTVDVAAAAIAKYGAHIDGRTNVHDGFSEGVCHRLFLNALASNDAYLSPNEFPYTFTASVSGGTIYADAACTAGSETSTLVSGGSYYVQVNAGVTTFSLSGADAFSRALATQDFPLAIPSDFRLTRADKTTPISSFMKNYCHEVWLEPLTSGGIPFVTYPTSSLPAFTYQLSVTAGSITAYSDAGCSSAIAGNTLSFTTPAQISNAFKLYLKFTSPLVSSHLRLTSVSTPSIYVNKTTNWIDADHVGFAFTSTGSTTGTLEVSMRNSNDNPVVVSEPIGFALSLPSTTNFWFAGSAAGSAGTIAAGSSSVSLGVQNIVTPVSTPLTGASTISPWFFGDSSKFSAFSLTN